MTASEVTELMAARRYLTRVLLKLDVAANEITVGRFIELLDYFAAKPSEYLDLINDKSI